MSDRYKLVIDQSDNVVGNDPQIAEGALAFVMAALHQWSTFPQYGVVSIELRRV